LGAKIVLSFIILLGFGWKNGFFELIQNME